MYIYIYAYYESFTLKATLPDRCRTLSVQTLFRLWLHVPPATDEDVGAARTGFNEGSDRLATWIG